MQIQLSPEEITAIRRMNARIQGHFGGLAKTKKKARTSRRNGSGGGRKTKDLAAVA